MHPDKTIFQKTSGPNEEDAIRRHYIPDKENIELKAISRFQFLKSSRMHKYKNS
jgi:hypothetical protein